MKKNANVIKELGIKRGDIIIAALLLAFSAVMGRVVLIASPAPVYAVIEVGGNEICQLPLNKDCVYHIGETNTIQISDGAVSMIDADCPDKICIHTGKISNSGRSIVCLPNRVVVSIRGEDSSADVWVR